jgi:hypothetical protein
MAVSGTGTRRTETATLEVKSTTDKAGRAATELASHCDRAGIFNFQAPAFTVQEGSTGPSLPVLAPTVGRPGARTATLAIRATRLVRSGVRSSSLAVQASNLVLVSMRKSLWI